MNRLLYGAPIALFACLLLVPPASGEESGASHRFGDSLFVAGQAIDMREDGLRNVYAAGERVAVDAAVAGTVHAAGRAVRLEAPIGGSVYAGGYSVDVAAPVAGNVTAAGYEVTIAGEGSVGGDALLGGRYVAVDGPITGNAMLTGETVEIAAPIAGSVEIRAREIRFGPGAQIGGTLAYWSDRAAQVPDGVIAADKVTATILTPPPHPPAASLAIGGALFFGLVLLVLAALFVLVLMPALAGAGAALAARPGRSFLIGIVALSALFGSIFVFAVSLIGIPLVPVVILLIPLVLAAGYITSAYALGGRLLARIGAPISDNRWAALGAVVVGLVILALLHAIPIFGWVVGVLATLFGLGALALHIFGRRAAEPPALP